MGHLDTVPAEQPITVQLADGRVYGRGASDMKAGLALMWQLLAEPVMEAAYDVAYLFYDGEEGPYNSSGLGPLMSELSWLPGVTLAFFLEPSDNALQLGCMGNVQASIRYHGRSAHSARPWQGINAIHRAAPLIDAVSRRSSRDVTLDTVTFREVMSLTMARAGIASNVIPDLIELGLNFRFAPDLTLAAATAEVRNLAGNDAEIEYVDLAPSGTIPCQNAAMEAFIRATGVPVEAKQAWTDVGRFSEAGIPAVNFGPGEKRAGAPA